MDARLAAAGAKAVYREFDTKLDPGTIPAILDAVHASNPDLICTVNYPTVFADNMITKKLAGTNFRIVSSNPIPVQSGVIADWQKPGGNVTGVGVFLKFNPQIKLMKMLNPAVKKMAFVSWNTTVQLNEWFELEVRRACAEEAIEFVEFRRVADYEEEAAFYAEYDKKNREYFVMGGISAWVHKDGSPAELGKLFPATMKKLKKLQYISYDENVIHYGSTAGACVIWHDIGVQMAEKGFQILEGSDPGELPWEYPRKYNIMLNLMAAKNRGLTVPQSLINAAYRVYTDFEGNFLGSKN